MDRLITTVREITIMSHLLTRLQCVVVLLGGCEGAPENVVWSLKMKHKQLSETRFQRVDLGVLGFAHISCNLAFNPNTRYFKQSD